MNAADLRARLTADLYVAHAARQADRPDGLTASSVGGCMSYAARTLLDEPKGTSDDFWRALRGGYVHSGLADDLTLVDPGFLDGRKAGRFEWNPGEGLPIISGEFDFILTPPAGSAEPPVIVEVKTRSKQECRWHADHGADPQHGIQVAMAADALSVPAAAVCYLPTDSGWSEVAIAMVDVAWHVREARAFLRQVDVRAEYEALVSRGVPREQALRQVLDPVPRDKPMTWCRLLCERVATCRGDYIAPADLEIGDPVVRAAAAEAERWRQVRLDAARREEAAKSRLTHTEGVVHDEPGSELRVTQQHVAAKPGRRGHVRTVVERRPG